MSRRAGAPRVARGCDRRIGAGRRQDAVMVQHDRTEAADMSCGAEPRAAGATGELPQAADCMALWFGTVSRRRRG